MVSSLERCNWVLQRQGQGSGLENLGLNPGFALQHPTSDLSHFTFHDFRPNIGNSSEEIFVQLRTPAISSLAEITLVMHGSIHLVFPVIACCL